MRQRCDVLGHYPSKTRPGRYGQTGKTCLGHQKQRHCSHSNILEDAGLSRSAFLVCLGRENVEKTLVFLDFSYLEDAFFEALQGFILTHFDPILTNCDPGPAEGAWAVYYAFARNLYRRSDFCPFWKIFDRSNTAEPLKGWPY